MPQKSTKFQQGAVIPISIKFDGGLNYSASPSQIQDNELTRAYNIIYNSQTGTPETRPGTVCVTALPLANPILKIYYYEKSAVLKWLIGVSFGNLYYLNGNAWVLIGALNDTTTTPAFLTFNTALLIADGGVNLKKWDGVTLSSLTDGLAATEITEMGARVVINSSTSPDLVTFSGVANETMWNTADPTNPAIGLRCGFGDNMNVNCFGTFGTDLIVSKRGFSEKRLYRINTKGVPATWEVSKLSSNNCAQNNATMVGAFNDVFFVDTDGFKSLKGVQQYGDLQVDVTGEKINAVFGTALCREMTYIPKYTAIWFLADDKIYAYHQISGRPVFTELAFSQGQIQSIVQTGTLIYLAGLNGYLYKIDPNYGTDEVTPAVFLNYPTLVVGKRFNFPGGGILRRTAVNFKQMDVPGNTLVNIKAIPADGQIRILKTINSLAMAEDLFDATEELFLATTPLASMAGSSWVEVTRNRVRGVSLQFQIDSTSGRFGLEGLTAEVALVGS